MRVPRSWCALVLCISLPPSAISAQQPATRLLAEYRLGMTDADSVVLDLIGKTFYVLEVAGRDGEPTVVPTRPGRHRALVTPAGRAPDGSARYELYPGWSGPHILRVPGAAGAGDVLVRIYVDAATTDRAERRHDDGLAVGIALGGGVHSGYRLDPTGGEPPGGGGDLEGCIVAESGSRLSACIGLARQRFPDADLTVTWYFIEPRVRVWSGSVAGAARTDIGISLRIAQGAETRPRNISPSQLAPGIHVIQHLAADGRRRGWSVWLNYSHGRLGNVPETEFRDTDRLAAGLAWVP